MRKDRPYARCKILYCEECGDAITFPACAGRFITHCPDCGQFYEVDVKDTAGINGGFEWKKTVILPPKPVNYS